MSVPWSTKLRRGVDAAVSGARLMAAAFATPLPRSTVAERVASLRTDGLPLDRPVTVHWNEHLVPFIDAATDADLAVALGYVQAHLRFGHIAVCRRIVQGRLAEHFGPVAAAVDHDLRILGVGRAASAMLPLLPEATRTWVDGYVRGLNHYQATATPAHDARVLALHAEPFTAQDVIGMGRLAGNDVNWVGWASLLRWRDSQDWPRIWADALRFGGQSQPSFVAERAVQDVLQGAGRHGSNSVALMGSRTTHGRAILANDPHVGIFLPNLWFIVGLRSPSYHAVGLMIPGVPFLCLGRNAHIAWGATNMRAANSDLVDVRELPAAAIATERQTVKVRWGRDRHVDVRLSAYGPIISDTKLFPKAAGPAVALRWVGHGTGSDELTAMLEVSRARDYASFRGALTGFGVSGQNFLYADVEGHIGQVMAVHLPRRPATPPAQPVLAPGDSVGWDAMLTAADLPAAFDPPAGYLASANNQAAATDVLISTFFAANDRIVRLHQLVGGRRDWSVEALAALQTDVVRVSALPLRDRLVRHGQALAGPARTLLDRLAAWDGSYAAALQEPAAMELIAARLAEGLGPSMASELGSESIFEILAERLARLEPAAADALVASAVSGALRPLRRIGSWGDLHRLRLVHILGNLPGLARRYPHAMPPVSGSTTTIMKTAHGLVKGPHDVRFGANARHISDMGDPDANWFVLLGGQDGEVGSPAVTDMVPLWLAGRAVKVPLRLETVRATFPYSAVLTPAANSQG